MSGRKHLLRKILVDDKLFYEITRVLRRSMKCMCRNPGQNEKRRAESWGKLPLSFLFVSKQEVVWLLKGADPRGANEEALCCCNWSVLTVCACVRGCVSHRVFAMQRLGSHPMLKHTHKKKKYTLRTRIHCVSVKNHHHLLSPAAQLVCRRKRTDRPGSAYISRKRGVHTHIHTHKDVQSAG